MPKIIKFRAWHNPLQRMFYGDSQEDAEFWGAKVGASVFGTFIYAFTNLFLKNNGQLMQYIGLKDKHGKEIYEGDILQLENNKCQIQKARIIGIVTFSFNSFAVEIKRVDIWEKYLVPPLEIDSVLYFLNLSGKELEVIGNIYENPELVKEKAND